MPVEVTGSEEFGDVPKIELPEDFVGAGEPMSIEEMFYVLKEHVKESEWWKSVDMGKVVDNIRQGDTITLAYLGFSVVVAMYIGSGILTSIWSLLESPKESKKEEEEEEEKDPPRDFTLNQLREFDGTKGKPIYIGLQGEVFDVSSGADFYGEGCSYHCFAGRDSSRAMARLSFDEEDLSNTDLSDLGPFEKSQLDDWVQKFKYFKCYPIVGRVSAPPTQRDFKRGELAAFKGLQEVPEGRIDAPIYVGINDKVLDVSYGGKEMYGNGGPYFIFAGIDASRALAKMSFDQECLESSDLSDLNETQKKTLSDWEKKFIAVRKYPVVGRIVSE